MVASRRIGTVVQIKGRYYARWTVEGKRVYGDPRDTYELADRDRVNSGPKHAPIVKKTEIPCLGAWAQQMQEGEYGKGVADSTLSTNETIRLNHLEGSRLAEMKLHRIRKPDCQAWVNGLTASPSYIRRCAAFVSKMLSLAVDAGMMKANPMSKVILPEVEERENRTLSPEEAVVLLNPQTRTDALMIVAMQTGMRRGELRRLEWRHVGTDTLKVPGTKSTKSRRAVPLTEEVRAAIDQQPRRSKYIFTTESGLQLGLRNISRDFKVRKSQVGLPAETRLQDLRGSYVSLLIEQGADLRAVMELAGHADLRTTMKAYARSRQVVKHAAVEKLRQSMQEAQG